MDPARRLPLSERLRPRRLDEIVGNAKAREELRRWAEEWNGPRPPARRAALLMGPPGVGKTTAALALAEENGWTLVEMNASDARNEAAINLVAGRASVSHTLAEPAGRRGRTRALILLDEADCLTGRLNESARTTPPPPSLREFLRARYREVESLNSAWGLGSGRTKPFADWEAVPRTPGNSGWARLAASRTDLEEWRGAQKPPDLSDRGGLGAIAKLVRSTHQPLVLTVNDERTLTRNSPVFRSSVLAVRFYPIRDAEMAARLERVVRSEKIDLADGVIPAVVRRAAGDLRAALNDLDAVALLPAGPLQLTAVGTRDLTSDLVALTEEALSRHRYYRNVEVRDRVDTPPDDILPWMEENIPHFAPDRRHAASAFTTLAVADQFLQRARRQRVWGLWSYASELLTGGVSIMVRDEAVPIRSGASFPRFLGEMGRSRGTRAVRKGLVEKLGHRFHLSREKTGETLLPFLESVFLATRRATSDPEWKPLARGISRELDLTAEEVASLLGVEPSAALVLDLVAPDEAAEPASEPASEPSVEEIRTPGGGESADAPPRKVQRQLSDFGS